MAQKRVEAQEIIQPNIFGDAAKSAQLLTKELEGLKIAFSQVSNESEKVFKGVSGAKTVADIDNVSKQLEKQEAVRKRLELAAERERLAEIRLQQQREKAFDDYEKKLNREQQKLQASQSVYSKLQQKLNALNKEYRDLAVRKELGAKLSDKEAQRIDYLSSRITKYDTTLKAVDASMGKYQRNVGNYASGFNPINNSINQLTREMPAFTYSMQTGFMAISNNIPIFTDAINNAVSANKELIAQGKPTTSVLKQVLGALFSWQTAMGVGITLLTVYGKEIGEWIKSLWGANDALNELTESQNKFKAATLQSRKDAQGQITDFRNYIKTAQDVAATDDARRIAVERLRAQFPYYFKNLSDAAIMNGKSAIAEQRVTEALQKRIEAELKTEELVKVKQQALEITESLNALEKEYQETITGAMSAEQGVAKRNELDKERMRLWERQKPFMQTIANMEADIVKLKNESILLEFQDRKEKNKSNKEQINYLAQARDAEIAQMTDVRLKQRAELQARFEDMEAAIKKEGKFNEEYKKALQDQLDFELAEMQSKWFKEDQEKFIKAQRDKAQVQVNIEEEKLYKIQDQESKAYKAQNKILINEKIKFLEQERDLVEISQTLSDTERLKRVSEINVEIAKLNQSVFDKELKETKSYYAQWLSAIREALDERARLQNEYFNVEQKERERQINQQTQLATRGFANQLAFEESQAKKADLKRKERLKKEQREREALQTATAFLTSYDNNLKQGLPASQAISKAFSDTFVARGIARTFVQFFKDGSSYVDAPWASGKKDDIPAMLMKGEAVITQSANAQNPGVADALNKGIFSDVFVPKARAYNIAENMGVGALVQEIKDVKSLLSSIADKPSQNIEVDSLGNIIERVHTRSAIITTKHVTNLNNWKK
jgi:hypothetical protein